MPNLVPGDIEYAYNRYYVVVNPDPSKGPPTYRISNPDELAGPGGGGTSYNFNGEPPVNVDVIKISGASPDTVTTSLDLKQLDDRT